jgi:ubiquinone/menaquinone biosynthesis C-methylase UbiE
MENFNKKAHWENIYTTKELKDVSWYQPIPQTSLDYLKQFNIPFDAKIIDVGGGDSFFVDHLLELGYSDVSVLDISEASLERAKDRLGEKATKVKWIVADASNFHSSEKYDFWHDRAAFHFLTEEQDIENYIQNLNKSIAPNGIIVIGTFSEEGPTKCSGIEIKQYSMTTLTEKFEKYFEKIDCKLINHTTPSNAIQNFVFCCFKKMTNVLPFN